MPDPYLVKPDREFLHRILGEGGGDLKKCFQCATCSVVCELSDSERPFPRKEMVWAQWGLKDRLVADPDVWLCHQCSDCSTRCPRGARPGDVLAALRQETIEHFAVPSFFARWINRPKYLPLVLAIPVVLLGLLILAPFEGGAEVSGSRPIVFPCWSELPHWLLITLFGLATILSVGALVVGIVRFWAALKAAGAREGAKPSKSLGASITAAMKRILTHEKFAQCGTDRPRFFAHFAVLFGFLAISLVPIWVLTVIFTAGHNPLVPSDFAYPFNFFNPWRMLANLAGVAIVAGCLLMIWERVKKWEEGNRSSYFDWSLLAALLTVAGTGLLAEALHYARMEPHRYAAYFLHLAAILVLLMHLPYSKFAHLAYRTTAMVYAEHIGRSSEVSTATADTSTIDTTATDDTTETVSQENKDQPQPSQ